MTGNLLTALRKPSMRHPVSRVFRPDPTTLLENTLISHKRGFGPGKILKLEGELSSATYCMLDGWLALSKSMEDGQRQIIDFLLPGDIMNPTSANENTSAVQIEVLSYARVSIIPTGTWAGLLDQVPSLETRENHFIASALSRLSERMLRLGKGTAEMRVAYSLLELYLRLDAIGKADNCKLCLPLTQQQLGDFAGLSSVHVCRTMRRLAHRNILTAHGQMEIVIHDLDALAVAASVDLATLKSEIIPAPDINPC